MKRTTIYLLLALALLTGCSHRHAVPPEDTLYSLYAARQDLKVAQIAAFALCDTVSVDVIMLQTDDTAAWRRLTEEMDIRGEEGTVSWLADYADPARRVQWSGDPVIRVIASHDKKAVGLYRIENEVQYDALLDYQIEKTKNKE